MTQSASEIVADNEHDEIFLSDTGNSKRLVGLHNDIIRYVPERELWYVRQKTRWEPDVGDLHMMGLTASVIREIRHDGDELPDEPGPNGALSPRARHHKHAMGTEAEGARRRMVSLTRSDPRIRAAEDDFDADFDLLATQSGMVNLNTESIEDNTAKHLNACVTIAPWDPNATSPLLDEYLDKFVPDPRDQRVLFGILGQMIRGGNTARMFPFWVGTTTSGKSMLLEALDRLLGDYCCTVNSSIFRGNLDDKPRPDLVRAMYKRVAYAVEASKIWELHADQVKRLTGGDPIPYRNLYAQAEEKVPRFTPLIVTNEMPRIKGADEALKRRMLVFRFDQTIAKSDEDTSKKGKFVRSDEVMRALQTRIVRGAHDDMFLHGIDWNHKDLPIKYAAHLMDAFGSLGHVEQFLYFMEHEGYIETVDMETPASHCARAIQLHKAYTYWVKEHGDKTDKAEVMSSQDLNAALRERGWESAPSAGTRWRGRKLTHLAMSQIGLTL